MSSSSDDEPVLYRYPLPALVLLLNVRSSRELGHEPDHAQYTFGSCQEQQYTSTKEYSTCCLPLSSQTPPLTIFSRRQISWLRHFNALLRCREHLRRCSTLRSKPHEKC